MDPFSLAGCGVCVTGAAGHLGQAMTASLLNAGASVVAVGRHRDGLEDLRSKNSKHGAQLELCAGDVGNRSTFDAAIEIFDRIGVPLRGWVNNAYAGQSSQFVSLSREPVQETIESALTNAMLLTDWAGTAMSSQGGAIVNVASMYGVVSPQPRVYDHADEMRSSPAYGAAKAGLIQFTRYAAVHFGPVGVRVNTLTPGPFPNSSVRKDTQFVAELEARTPLGRVGDPQEVGGAIVFLLSSASSFMTGQQLIVDGGWTAW